MSNYTTLTPGTEEYHHHEIIVKELIYNLALDHARKTGIIYEEDVRIIVWDALSEKPDLILPVFNRIDELYSLTQEIFERVSAQLDKIREDA